MKNYRNKKYQKKQNYEEDVQYVKKVDDKTDSQTNQQNNNNYQQNDNNNYKQNNYRGKNYQRGYSNKRGGQKNSFKQKLKQKMKQKNIEFHPSNNQQNQYDYHYLLNQQTKDIQNELSIFDEYKKFIEIDSQKPHLKNYSQQNLTILMVAEKPSIARDIYSALSNKKVTGKKDNYHRFSGQFLQHKAFFTVTSVRGHVLQRDFPKRFSNWQTTDPLSLFNAETVKLDCDKGQTRKQLQKLSEKIDCIFLWLDNDREGENISFEILSTIFSKMKKQNFKQIYRVIFSSLVKRDLQNAFINVTQGPDLNQALAVEARQIFDLKVGVAFSRFLTLNLKKEFAKFKDKKITYGPCQIPTLSLVFQRNKAIEEFKPEQYFSLDFKIKFGNSDPLKVTLKNKQNRFKTQKEAMEFYQQIKKKGVLKNIKVQKQRKPRPRGLNTVNMLKFITKNLGMSSHQAMHAAERLYLSGYMTYPRTESTQYPNKFDFKSILGSLKNGSNLQYSQYAGDLYQNGYNSPLKGQDAGDHPPIAPTEKIPSNLPYDQQKIYDFVVSNFLQSISQDTQTENTIYVIQFGQHEFTFQNVRVLKQGYLKVKGKQMTDTNVLGNIVLKEGDEANLFKAVAQEQWTKSPTHITESELLAQMEKYNIGTDASMAIHINNIIDREYVQVQDSDRKLVPTDLGKTLVESLYQIDPEIVEPTLRGKVELKMNLIAQGKTNFHEAVIKILETFKKKYKYFVDHFGNLVDNLKKYYESSEEVMKHGKNFGRCGTCKKFLSYADSLKKITCTSCKDWVYQFPDTVVHLTPQYCHKDNFPLLEVKIMLGLSDKEIQQSQKDNTEDQLKEFAKKARGYGIFIQMCPFCAFQAQENSKFYFAENQLNKNCKNCNKKTFLCTDKQKKNFFSICSNSNCYTLILFRDDLKQIEQIKDECQQCNSKKFSVLENSGSRNDICIVCNDKTKYEDLGQHCQYNKFKRQNFKKKNFYKNNQNNQDDNDNNDDNKIHRGRGQRRGRGKGRGRGRGKRRGRGGRGR